MKSEIVDVASVENSRWKLEEKKTRALVFLRRNQEKGDD